MKMDDLTASLYGEENRRNQMPYKYSYDFRHPYNMRSILLTWNYAWPPPRFFGSGSSQQTG